MTGCCPNGIVDSGFLVVMGWLMNHTSLCESRKFEILSDDAISDIKDVFAEMGAKYVRSAIFEP